MAGAFRRRDAQIDLAFQTPDDDVVAGRCTELKVFGRPDGSRDIVLVVDFPYASFLAIEDKQLFGLTPESIDPSVQSWQLDSYSPIEIELQLSAAAQQADDGENDEARLDALASRLSATEPGSALLDPSSYRYLSVLQSRLAGRANLMTGFRSTWARESHWG